MVAVTLRHEVYMARTGDCNARSWRDVSSCRIRRRDRRRGRLIRDCLARWRTVRPTVEKPGHWDGHGCFLFSTRDVACGWPPALFIVWTQRRCARTTGNIIPQMLGTLDDSTGVQGPSNPLTLNMAATSPASSWDVCQSRDRPHHLCMDPNPLHRTYKRSGGCGMPGE